MQFTFELSAPVIRMLCTAALGVAFITLYYCPRVARIGRRNRADNLRASGLKVEYGEPLPEVSVVVYAQDQAEQLSRLLPQLLEQDYPSPFEVIVVNEGQSEATEEAVAPLVCRYRNLYLTYTPDGARNLSRKKLALTLGIKAARYPVVAIVDADTSVNSARWLRIIGSHFLNPACEVVIGGTKWDAADDDMRGHGRRAFGAVSDMAIYLSAAIGGRPYRASGHNLAYRKNLFFENKGFSRSLNLRYGDDDVFVSEITRGYNTEVELASDAVNTMHCLNPARAYKEIKLRRMFTGRFISKRSRRMMGGVSSAMFWLWLASSVAAVAMGLPNLLPAAAVLLLGVGLWVPVVLSWRGAMGVLSTRRLTYSIPWHVMARPLWTGYYSICSRRNRTRNYTWG